MRKEAKKYFRCDKCGKEHEYSTDIKNDMNAMIIDNKCWSLYSNHGQAWYGSKLDGCDVNFDLCDDCLIEFIETFKYKELILDSGF